MGPGIKEAVIRDGLSYRDMLLWVSQRQLCDRDIPLTSEEDGDSPK